MIEIKVTSPRLSKTLTKLNTSSEAIFGGAVENLLRKVVTGKGSQSLSDGNGLQQLAKEHAPKPSDIESDIRKLKSALIKRGGQKKLTRLTPVNRKEILKQRIKAIGYTARTLLLNWAEATAGRSSVITGKLSKYHYIKIETANNLPKATFTSKHKGLIKINKQHNIVKKVLTNLRKELIPYLTQVSKDQFKKDIK